MIMSLKQRKIKFKPRIKLNHNISEQGLSKFLSHVIECLLKQSHHIIYHVILYDYKLGSQLKQTAIEIM